MAAVFVCREVTTSEVVRLMKLNKRRTRVHSAMPTWTSQWRRWLACAMLCLGSASPVAGQELAEYQVKAAFLYNFAVFAEWPSAVGDMLKLCVYGRDPFGSSIDSLNDKIINARRLGVVRRTNLNSIKDCQIVFVTSSEIGQLPRILEILSALPVLIVADSPGAARRGAAINLTMTQGHVLFEVNLLSLHAARLGMSSKVLGLAKEVIQ